MTAADRATPQTAAGRRLTTPTGRAILARGIASTAPGDKYLAHDILAIEAEARAAALAPVERRLVLAEQVCLMVGWSAASPGKRGKALHELWAEWRREYERVGGSSEPHKHPELSDARIRELAQRRDAKVARTLARFAGDAEQGADAERTET